MGEILDQIMNVGPGRGGRTSHLLFALETAQRGAFGKTMTKEKAVEREKKQIVDIFVSTVCEQL